MGGTTVKHTARKAVAYVVGSLLLLIASFVAVWHGDVRASEQTVMTARLLNNVTATSATRGVVGGPMANCRETAVYVSWLTGVTAGAVTIETADNSAYAGTWAPLQVVTFSSTAPREDVVQITGIHGAIGARISTTVSGGGAPGVTVFALCN